VRQLARTGEHADIETLEGEPVAGGALPILCSYQSPNSGIIGKLERFLTEAVTLERIFRDSVAILC